MLILARVARVCALAVSLVFLSGAVGAQTTARPFEQTYRVILPQKVETGDRIEIIDFFWYGCPFCYELLPIMSAWEKRKGTEIAVRRIPAILREGWLADAHLYYTLELLGETERLHATVFNSVHKDQLRTSDQQAVEAWAVQNGIDRQKWVGAYTNVEVRNRVVRAMELGRNYDVRGTPAVVVDGRYQTGGGIAGGLGNVPAVLDALVDLAREQRKKP
jgi:thiol:disulfide interchange protein DsbA